jgi:hypothetical protein
MDANLLESIVHSERIHQTCPSCGMTFPRNAGSLATNGLKSPEYVCNACVDFLGLAVVDGIPRPGVSAPRKETTKDLDPWDVIAAEDFSDEVSPVKKYPQPTRDHVSLSDL